MEVVARRSGMGRTVGTAAREAAAPAGDVEFERRLAEHAPGLAALLRRTARSPDLRNDALQETLLRAWRERGRYDAARPLGPWLATIALRVARDLERGRRRRGAREETLASPADEADAHASDGVDPADAAERGEQIERLERALAELDDVPRRIVVAFHRELKGVQEIATAMELPVNTVKSHLRRARLKLARALRDGGDAR